MFQAPVLTGLATGLPSASGSTGRGWERRLQGIRRSLASRVCKASEGQKPGSQKGLRATDESKSGGCVFSAWADQRHLRARDYENSSKDGRVSIFKLKAITKPPMGDKNRHYNAASIIHGPFAFQWTLTRGMKQNSLAFPPWWDLCWLSLLHFQYAPPWATPWFYQIICGSWQGWPAHATWALLTLPPLPFLLRC